MSSFDEPVVEDVPELSIVILGERGTGKSHLATRYTQNRYADTQALSCRTTLAVEGQRLNVVINDVPGGGTTSRPMPESVPTPDTPLFSHPPLSAYETAPTSIDGDNDTQTIPAISTVPGTPTMEPLDFGELENTTDLAMPSLGTDLVFASFQGDYRRRLIQRSDALVLVFNPWKRETFEWINETLLHEVAEGSQKKYLGKHVAKLLDGLSGTTPKHGSISQRSRTSLTTTGLLMVAASAGPMYREAGPTIANAAASGDRLYGGSGAGPFLPEGTDSKETGASTDISFAPTPIQRAGLSRTTTNQEHNEMNPALLPRCTQTTSSPTSLPHPFAPHATPTSAAPRHSEVDPDYPVLLVGACVDRLQEYGGDKEREVSIEEATALAKRFNPLAEYVEVSAREDKNVEAAFTVLVRQVLEVWESQDEKEQETEHTANKLQKRQPTASIASQNGSLLKKVLRGLGSCFVSPKPGLIESPILSVRSSVVSVKMAQAVTIRRFPSGASAHGPPRRQGPIPRCIAGRRTRSKAPTLREINPLPRITLDDISVPDSIIGPILPNPHASPRDSVIDPVDQLDKETSLMMSTAVARYNTPDITPRGQWPARGRMHGYGRGNVHISSHSQDQKQTYGQFAFRRPGSRSLEALRPREKYDETDSSETVATTAIGALASTSGSSTEFVSIKPHKPVPIERVVRRKKGSVSRVGDEGIPF